MEGTPIEGNTRKHTLGKRTRSGSHPKRTFRPWQWWLVGAGFLMTLLGMGFGVSMAIKAERLAQSLERAEREAERSGQVSDFLVALFEISEPDAVRSHQLLARDVLDIGAKRIRSQVRQDPALRAELLQVMARTYRALGLVPESEALVLEALGSAGELDPGERWALRFEQALVLDRLGNSQGALNLIRELLGEVEAQEVPDLQLRFEVQASLVGALANDGKAAEAVELAGKWVTQAGADFGVDSENYGQALLQRGAHLGEMGRYPAAIEDLLGGLDVLEHAVGEGHPKHLTGLRGLGRTYLHAGELDLAIETLERALALDREVFGENHPNVDWDLYQLARVLARSGELDQAIEVFLEVLERDKKNLGDHPYVGVDMTEIANLYSRRGDFEEAQEYFERGVAIQRRHYSPDHLELAATLSHWAEHHVRTRNFGEALDLHEEALTIRRGSLPARHPLVLTSRNSKAVVQVSMGKLEQAEKTFRGVYEARKEALGDHPEVANSQYNLANVLLMQGRLDPALVFVDLALEGCLRFFPAGGIDVARVRELRGRILLGLDRHAGAEAELRLAQTAWGAHLDPDHRRLGELAWRLGQCLVALDRFDEAQAEYLKALATFEGDRGLNPDTGGQALVDCWAEYVEACRAAGRQPKRAAPQWVR